MKLSLLFVVLMLQSMVQAQTAQVHVAKNMVPLASPTTNVITDTGGFVKSSSGNMRMYSKKIKDLSERFSVFSPLADNEVYSITIAADVPDDSRPHKVYVKREPGHVFVILEQTDTISGKTVAQVWGFYPVRPVSCVFVRTVRCELNDNGGRKYDAAISRRLSATEFTIVQTRAIELARHRYNLNKYNCYDYAVELFNSVAGMKKLPLTHVKFPFIFGRGGSPCGLYRDLAKLQSLDSVWALQIKIGSFQAPLSTQSINSINPNQ